MKTILAPIDFSEVSGKVVSEASLLARACDGRVVLFTVVQPPAFPPDYSPMRDTMEEAVAASERVTAKNLEKIAAPLRADSIPVETLQATGAPVANIVEQAQKSKADYIVMGSHGHSAIFDLFLGTTSHGVLKQADCPVVIVPPPKTKIAKKK